MMRRLIHQASLPTGLAPFLGLVLVGLGAAAIAMPVQATETVVPDSFLLGRDANGEPCTASRTWDDPRVSKYDRTYAITCRGVAAGRSQGTLMIINADYPEAADANCAQDQAVDVKDIGQVSARQCFDAQQGIPLVTASFKRGKYLYRGEASFTATGPMEAGLRTLAEVAPPIKDRYQDDAASITPANLPAAPTVAATDTTAPGNDSFLPEVTLGQGILLNQQGSYVEASRMLNDGLSRLRPDTATFTRAEFDLEAAVADSNIGQFDSADAHFADAKTLLGNNGADKVGTYLLRKLSTYEALDAINRRQWNDALSALQSGESATNPLMDTATLATLNQSSSNNRASGSTAVVDRGELASKLLEAQRNWAASVAWLGAGDNDKAAASLDQAVVYVNLLQQSVRADSLIGMKARIERQKGRLLARLGKTTEAVTDFDCALALLQGGVIKDSSGCLFDLAPSAAILSTTGSGAFAGPVIAETQLERASLLARDPALKPEDVIQAYSSAIDSLLASSDVGERQPVELEPYFDILIQKAAADPTSGAEELYFKAIQAIGEPAVARQVAQLQTVVTGDSALGAKVRDRSELERRVVQLRYQIATNSTLDAAAVTDLDQQRQTAENELLAVNTELAADPHFRMVDDQLVKIADIRAALKPGEFYLKVTELKQHAYAIVIGRGETFLYRIAVGSDALTTISNRVRMSIRDDSGQLPYFDVQAAYALFHLITGPAETKLRLARAIIVDPSGPLENLPASVLVTSPDSVKRYLASAKTAPYDYSHVDFVAYRSDVYYALSPRSLLISRSLPPSQAAHPFIGFGQNAPPPADLSSYAGKKIDIGGCDMDYGDFLGIMAANKPVSAEEIGLAANALGAGDSPEVTGPAFTDTALMQASDTGAYEQYQVVHFATHGIPESKLGCSDVPPSLITTVAPIDASGQIVSDGFLTFPDVAQMRFDANLVVLSACDTAAGVSGQLGRLSGQDESAATLDGLVRAFITARARAVMATYWNVPASSETDQFIQTFYSTGRIYDMGMSLRKAQTTLIGQAQYSHPYFWGAYVLIGDGSKTMLSQPPQATASVTTASAQ